MELINRRLKRLELLDVREVAEEIAEDVAQKAAATVAQAVGEEISAMKKELCELRARFKEHLEGL